MEKWKYRSINKHYEKVCNLWFKSLPFLFYNQDISSNNDSVNNNFKTSMNCFYCSKAGIPDSSVDKGVEFQSGQFEINKWVCSFEKLITQLPSSLFQVIHVFIYFFFFSISCGIIISMVSLGEVSSHYHLYIFKNPFDSGLIHNKRWFFIQN